MTNSTFGRIKAPTHANPILSAMQFATRSTTPDPEAGGVAGATMNVHTGRLLAPGDSGYVVGKEPNDKGETVPTTEVPLGEMTPLKVLEHRYRLEGESKNRPNASLGSWVDTKSSNPAIEVDQSGVYQDKQFAENLGRERGEKAIWSNGNMDEIRLDGK